MAICRALMNAGADVNALNDAMATPLHKVALFQYYGGLVSDYYACCDVVALVSCVSVSLYLTFVCVGISRRQSRGNGSVVSGRSFNQRAELTAVHTITQGTILFVFYLS